MFAWQLPVLWSSIGSGQVVELKRLFALRGASGRKASLNVAGLPMVGLGLVEVS